jgi:hypothetical protein
MGKFTRRKLTEMLVSLMGVIKGNQQRGSLGLFVFANLIT